MGSEPQTGLGTWVSHPPHLRSIHPTLAVTEVPCTESPKSPTHTVPGWSLYLHPALSELCTHSCTSSLMDGAMAL